MIKVMIVDDELIVRVALRSIVDWEAFGFQIVAEAKNGREGIERYRALRPQLILTDVLMPEMDGLEMMRAIRAQDARVCFVVLSSYDDFSYAQQAMRVDAQEYLLKASLMEEDIEALLRRMFDRIAGCGVTPEEGKGWLSILLEGKTDTPDVCRQMKTLLGTTDARAVMLRLAGRPADAEQVRILRGIAETLLADTGIAHVSAPWQEGLLLLMSVPRAGAGVPLARRLRETTQQYLSRSLRIGVSLPVHTPQAVPEAAQQAYDAATQTLFAPDEPFCVFCPTAAGRPPLIDKKKREQLRALLADYRAQEAVDLIRTLFEGLSRTRDQHALYELIFALSALMCECRGMGEPDRPERVLQIDDIAGIREFYEASVYASVDVLRAAAAAENPYVAQVQAYIRAHYEEGITLAQLAGQLHLSASYLGKLFFAETGEHIADYLNTVRIARACEMIRSGSDSLSLVAQRVGFCNQAHFTRLFQKQMGMSPSAWRRQCRIRQKDS